MNSQPPSPFGGAPEQRGFEFPCSVEITAVGLAAPDWVERVTGLALDPDSVRSRDSSGGKYQSVTLAFHAEAREHYEAAHAALRALPGIKWTL
jgi:putative lipoic acid-binding regulatory protein